MAERRRLDVWFGDDLVGTLAEERAGLRFDYARPWRSAGRHPISHSLPLTGAHEAGAATTFFGGLLPEEEPRRVLARRIGVSVGNDFSLLERVAGDTAGALVLLRPGDGPPTPGHRTGEVEWLDEADLARTLTELPDRPMHVDADGTWRLSLAGAQDKLPVVASGGSVGLTRGGEPSTHIAKTAIRRVEDSVVNEAFCLRFARELGVTSVDAEPRSAGPVEYLLVTRYDREAHVGHTERLHQEDFCQALGVPSARKYEAEGGPSLAECFDLARAACSVPARDVPQLAALSIVNFLVGNHDAHGKNFSLLYGASGTVVAPAYDVLSTAVYNRRHDLSRSMAMRLGGEYRPEYVRARHLQRLLDEAGLRGVAGRRFLVALVERAVTAAARTRGTLRESGWDRPVLGAIEELVEERAGLLTSALEPRPSSPRV